MKYAFRGTAGDRSGDVYELIDEENGPGRSVAAVGIQLPPLAGSRQTDGRWADILYTRPDWETNPVPTRSGHPILFPFPGRLRDGNIHLRGQDVPASAQRLDRSSTRSTVSLRETAGASSTGTATTEFAFVTGEFNLEKDLPDARCRSGPRTSTSASHTARIADRLRVDARVENLGPARCRSVSGYHPYFRLPGCPTTPTSAGISSRRT